MVAVRLKVEVSASSSSADGLLTATGPSEFQNPTAFGTSASASGFATSLGQFFSEKKPCPFETV